MLCRNVFIERVVDWFVLKSKSIVLPFSPENKDDEFQFLELQY